MDTRDLVVGSRIEHGLHGSGAVTFVGTDYLGIAFDGAGETLIRRLAFGQSRLAIAEEIRLKRLKAI